MRDQVFLLQVTLDISAAQSTTQVVVSGGERRGQSYTMPPPFHFLSLQLGEIRLWKGFGDPGASTRRIW